MIDLFNGMESPTTFFVEEAQTVSVAMAVIVVQHVEPTSWIFSWGRSA